jgi:hypothetical protein
MYLFNSINKKDMNEEYGFFSKNGAVIEIIYKIRSTSKENAVKLFAQMKNLSVDTFKSLYSVIKIR